MASARRVRSRRIRAAAALGALALVTGCAAGDGAPPTPAFPYDDPGPPTLTGRIDTVVPWTPVEVEVPDEVLGFPTGDPVIVPVVEWVEPGATIVLFTTNAGYKCSPTITSFRVVEPDRVEIALDDQQSLLSEQIEQASLLDQALGATLACTADLRSYSFGLALPDDTRRPVTVAVTAPDARGEPTTSETVLE